MEKHLGNRKRTSYQFSVTTIYRPAAKRDVDDVVTISVSWTTTEVVDCNGNKFRAPLRSGVVARLTV